MAVATYSLIEIDEDGCARVVGKGLKVRELVKEHLHWAFDAAALQQNHPELTLQEAHAVIGYYYDHQKEMNAEIADAERMAEEIEASSPEPQLLSRLRRKGKIA